MYGYIYKTTNIENGKFYIGKHKSDSYDPDYLGSGVYITSAIAKHGEDKFTNEIIDTADSADELNEKEKFWITKLDARNLGYNIAPGGDGGAVWGDPSNHPSLGKGGLKGESNPMYKRLKANPDLREELASDMRNRRHIIGPDGERRFVHIEDIQDYLDKGWRCPRLEAEQKEKDRLERLAVSGKKRLHPGRKKGVYYHSPETKEKMRITRLKLLSDPEFKKRMLISSCEGIRNRSKEQKEHFSEVRRIIQTGKKPSKEAILKRSETLKKGYASGLYDKRLGRAAWNKGIKMSEEEAKRLGQLAKGRIHVTNGTVNKMIYPEELQKWEEQGFHKGRTLKKKI